MIEACHGSKVVRLNLTGVPYFSSAGFRGLLMGYKVARLSGGKLEIYGANDVLRGILKDTGLDKELTICTGDAFSHGEDPASPSAVNEGEVSDNRGQETGSDHTDNEFSPDWVAALPQSSMVSRLLIVAVCEKTTAWISLHEKDRQSGRWTMLFSTVGFIGGEGLSDNEGAGRTRRGAYPFERGILTAFDKRRPFTDGRIALHKSELSFVLSHAGGDCLVVADTLDNLGGAF